MAQCERCVSGVCERCASGVRVCVARATCPPTTGGTRRCGTPGAATPTHDTQRRGHRSGTAPHHHQALPWQHNTRPWCPHNTRTHTHHTGGTTRCGCNVPTPLRSSGCSPPSSLMVARGRGAARSWGGYGTGCRALHGGCAATGNTNWHHHCTTSANATPWCAAQSINQRTPPTPRPTSRWQAQ